MNTALAYLTYALVIAVPAGLLFTGLIPLVRRLQLSFQPHFAHIPETKTDRTVAKVYAESQALRRAIVSFETALRESAAEVANVRSDPYTKVRDHGGSNDRVNDLIEDLLTSAREVKERPNPRLANAGVAEQVKGAAREYWKKVRGQDSTGAEQVKGATKETWGKSGGHDDVGIDPYSVKGRIQSQAEERRREH